MKMLLGQKLGMSQVFTPEGEVIPVTLIWAQPNAITLHRKADRDGYTAVQLALPHKNSKKDFVARREFKAEVAEDVKELSVTQFAPGDVIQVTGVSKGKGFQGVVKRHKMKGGPGSHGHTDWARKAGSIGSRFGQHTMKGKRMAGRMGADQVTVKNLKVIQINAENHVLAVKGAVPGVRGSVIAIESIEKK
jgi:large subunit ribosomal protein L3